MNRSEIFKIFSNDVRMKIFKYLLKGKMCVSGIVDRLNVSQPTVTQHLIILKQAGLVKSRKIGYWNHYSINKNGLKRVKKELKNLINILEINESDCNIPSSRCPEKQSKKK
jgi:ArsR family transcriptional regulator